VKNSLRSILIATIILSLLISGISCSKSSTQKPTVSDGFVKTRDGNFAVGVTGQLGIDSVWIGSTSDYKSVYKDYLQVTLVVTKTSTSEYGLDNPECHLLLVDDHGEAYAHSDVSLWNSYGYYDATPDLSSLSLKNLGPGFSASLLPLGFTWLTKITTNAPALALEHIDTVKLNSQEIEPVNYQLNDLAEISNVVTFGERIHLSDFITLTPSHVSTDGSSLDEFDFYVEVGNSSYDERTVRLVVGYQNTEGMLYLLDFVGSILDRVTLAGKSTELIPVPFLFRDESIYSVRAYLLYAEVLKYEEYELNPRLLRIVIPD